MVAAEVLGDGDDGVSDVVRWSWADMGRFKSLALEDFNVGVALLFPSLRLPLVVVDLVVLVLLLLLLLFLLSFLKLFLLYKVFSGVECGEVFDLKSCCEGVVRGGAVCGVVERGVVVCGVAVCGVAVAAPLTSTSLPMSNLSLSSYFFMVANTSSVMVKQTS